MEPCIHLDTSQSHAHLEGVRQLVSGRTLLLKNTKWSGFLFPSSRHRRTPTWIILSLVMDRGCLAFTKRRAKCRLDFLRLGLCGLPDTDTDTDEDDSLGYYCLCRAPPMDFFYPWMEGTSMDGSNFLSILPCISSLVFATNGAYHPWTAVPSIDARIHHWNATRSRITPQEKRSLVRQTALLDEKMSQAATWSLNISDSRFWR